MTTRACGFHLLSNPNISKYLQIGYFHCFYLFFTAIDKAISIQQIVTMLRTTKKNKIKTKEERYPISPNTDVADDD